MNQKTLYSDQVDFRTPPYLFHFIESLCGSIDYDGACEEGVNNLASPLRLEEVWPKGIVYSNPPFDTDSIIQWIEKGYEHSRALNQNIHLMLIPNKLCFVKLQAEALHLIDHIIFLGGRVDFSSPYATKGGTSRSGSIILIQKNNLNKGFSFKLLSDLKKNYQESLVIDS